MNPVPDLTRFKICESAGDQTRDQRGSHLEMIKMNNESNTKQVQVFEVQPEVEEDWEGRDRNGNEV